MRVAYFDAPSGISGDMSLAGLLDAGRGRGLEVNALRQALAHVPIGGYRLDLERVEVEGIRAVHLRVEIDETHDHHRTWSDIRALIDHAQRGGLSVGAANRARRIFEVLAHAEAKVHGIEPERVHFHEVGAVDSVIDIVGVAWCLDALGIDACFVSPLPSGSGYVDTEHGRLPVPAPATAELLTGFEVLAGDGEGELVTPTGAAILCALARPLRPTFIAEAVGCSAGTRRLSDRPNVLRVWIGTADATDEESVILVEADVDDMTPAAVGYLTERLRAVGARDVTVAPVEMKKGRLGMRLGVLCDLGRLEDVATRMLAESSTIGLRYRALRRMVLPRRSDTVETSYGPITVKVVRRPDGSETAEPEFEDVAAAARRAGQPLAAVRDEALLAWREKRS
jgi:uncharacterized protein (TIGR00299 family) protein